MCAGTIAVEHESVVVALDLIAQHITHGEGCLAMGTTILESHRLPRRSAIDHHRKTADGAGEWFIDQLFRKSHDVPDIFKNIQLLRAPKSVPISIVQQQFRFKIIGLLS